MKVVYHGMLDVRVDTVEDPKIEDGRDVTIRVTNMAIRGSDLYIYNGRLPQPRPMVFGHEFMGIVGEVDKGVGNKQKVGNWVVVSFPIACGTCFFATTIYSVIMKIPTPTTMAPRAAC